MARLSKVHRSSKPLIPITPARPPPPPPKPAPEANLVAIATKPARSSLRALLKAAADVWHVAPAVLTARFGQITSERFCKELKTLASAYSFDSACAALEKVRSERRSGKMSTPGVSRRVDWAPSDVVRARDLLRQQDEDSKTDDKEPVASDLDPELPRNNQTNPSTDIPWEAFHSKISAVGFGDNTSVQSTFLND